MDFCLIQIGKTIPISNGFKGITIYVNLRRFDSHWLEKTAVFGVCLYQVWVNSSNFPWDPGKFIPFLLNFKISIRQHCLRLLLGFNMGRWLGFLDLILILRLMPGYDLLQEL